MAQKFTVPVTIKNLSSAGSDGLTVFLDQESFARLKVEAGGRFTWGSGAGAGDTNLYRDAESVLKTDDTFKAAGLYVTGTQIDTTGATVGDALVFNGTKFVSASVAGGGATLTVADVAPEDPSSGDLWFNSNDLEIYVYYSSTWIQVTDSSSGVQELYELVDVLIDNPIDGETLVYNGAEWVNGHVSAGAATSLQTARVISLSGDISGSVSFDGSQNVSIAATIQPNSVALGTDTTGNYVSDITQGTGVTVSHTPGEGSSPTVAIGQAVGTSASVTFANVTANLIGNVTGNASTVTNGIYTSSSINALADVDTVSASPTSGQFLKWNGTNWVPDSVMSDPGYESAETYGPPVGTATTGNLTTSRTYYASFYLGKSVTFDRIGVSTGAGFSGTAIVRLGIYNMDTTTGRPSTVAFDAGTVSVSEHINICNN